MLNISSTQTFFFYHRKKLKQRARSLYSRFHPESSTDRGVDIICISSESSGPFRQLSLEVHRYPVTMVQPVEAVESHNLPNNDNSAQAQQ